VPTSPSSLIVPGKGPPSLGRFVSPRSTLVVPFLVWTAEGGTPGTDVTVANSGGASGDQWQAIQTGTDAVKRYSTLHSHRFVQCIEFATGSTATTPTVGWNAKIGTLTEVSFCMYVYFTARPALEHRLLHIHDVAGTAQRCSLSVRPDGVLQMLDSTGSTLAGDRTTKPIALYQWNRVEFHAILDATVGQYECRLYKTDPDAPELGYDEQVSSAANKNLGGAGGTYRFGVTGTAVANVNSWYADDLAVKAGRWIGPIGPSGQQVPAAGQVGTALHPGRGPSQFARFWQLPRATDIPATGGETHSGGALGEQRTADTAAGVKGAIGAAQGGTRVSGQASGIKGAAGAALGPARTAEVATVRKQTTGVASGAQRSTGQPAGSKGAIGAGAGQQRSSGIAVKGTPPAAPAIGEQRVSGITAGKKATSNAGFAQQHPTGLTFGIRRTTAAAVGQIHPASVGTAIRRAVGAVVGQQRSSGIVPPGLTVPPPRWTEHASGGSGIDDQTSGGTGVLEPAGRGTLLVDRNDTGTGLDDHAGGGIGIIEGIGGV
jgi:hypothetical protein